MKLVKWEQSRSKHTEYPESSQEIVSVIKFLSSECVGREYPGTVKLDETLGTKRERFRQQSVTEQTVLERRTSRKQSTELRRESCNFLLSDTPEGSL